MQNEEKIEVAADGGFLRNAVRHSVRKPQRPTLAPVEGDVSAESRHKHSEGAKHVSSQILLKSTILTYAVTRPLKEGGKHLERNLNDRVSLSIPSAVDTSRPV